MEVGTIIVGGGIAGLSFASELEKVGESYLLFEANSKVGGLCSSWIDRSGNWHDFGPHIFHGREGFDWFRDLVPDHLQGERTDLVVLADREVTSYPVQCACGDLSENARIWANYAQHCYHEYGEEMFWRFFFPYNQKMFGVSLFDLDRSIAGRAPRTTDRLQPYLYPRSGRFAELPENIYKGLKGSEERVHLSSPVDYVDPKERFIVSGNQSYSYKRLIWAASISTLLTILGRRSELPKDYVDLLLVTTEERPTLEFLAKYSALTSDEYYRMSTERVIKKNDSPFTQYEINLRRSIGTWYSRGQSIVVPEAYVVPTTDWIGRQSKIETELQEEDIFLHGRAGRGIHKNIWSIICDGRQLLSKLT